MELAPGRIQDYAKRALARAGSMPLNKDGEPLRKNICTEEPGSASSVAHASTPAALPSSGRDAKGEQEEQALPLELPAKKSRREAPAADEKEASESRGAYGSSEVPGTVPGAVLAGLYPGDALAEANKKRMLDEAPQKASEDEVAREAAGAGKEQGHGEGDTSGGGENPVEGMSAVEPSEAPAAAGPGSASPAAKEAERLDLSAEEPTRWQ